jgi:hypothetical protein
MWEMRSPEYFHSEKEKETMLCFRSYINFSTGLTINKQNPLSKFNTTISKFEGLNFTSRWLFELQGHLKSQNLFNAQTACEVNLKAKAWIVSHFHSKMLSFVTN